MSLPNDLLGLFTSESNKLENLVNAMNFDTELPVNQIVEVYYQITNVSSMITIMKQQLDETNGKILYAEKFISENFNSIIHPKIIQNFEQKSTEIIENEAKLYEKLREIMSTKEFVKQYDVGISHD